MLQSLENDLPMLKYLRRSAFNSKKCQPFTSIEFSFEDQITQKSIFDWVKQASTRDKKVLMAKLDSADSDWVNYRSKGVQNIFNED